MQSVSNGELWSNFVESIRCCSSCRVRIDPAKSSVEVSQLQLKGKAEMQSRQQGHTCLQAGLGGRGAVSIGWGAHCEKGRLRLLCPACHCGQQVQRVALILHASTPCSASPSVSATVCTHHRQEEEAQESWHKNAKCVSEWRGTARGQYTTLVRCKAPVLQQQVQQRRVRSERPSMTLRRCSFLRQQERSAHRLPPCRRGGWLALEEESRSCRCSHSWL